MKYTLYWTSVQQVTFQLAFILTKCIQIWLVSHYTNLALVGKFSLLHKCNFTHLFHFHNIYLHSYLYFKRLFRLSKTLDAAAEQYYYAQGIPGFGHSFIRNRCPCGVWRLLFFESPSEYIGNVKHVIGTDCRARDAAKWYFPEIVTHSAVMHKILSEKHAV